MIDPSKSLAGDGDYTKRQMDYWPSYSEVSASARRAYLKWLADGRKDPRAEVGFVFLFFYGLERRAIVDGMKPDGGRIECVSDRHKPATRGSAYTGQLTR